MDLTTIKGKTREQFLKYFIRNPSVPVKRVVTRCKKDDKNIIIKNEN
jgi:hypothetical protein